MKYPQLIVLEIDGWLAKHLRPLAEEHRWLIREPRTVEAALGFANELRPGVLLVQLDLGAQKFGAFALIADAHRLRPDIPVIAVSEVKLNDADRIAWTAAFMDLGARYVLFPPLTRPVVEDVVSGLMAASIRRATGGEPTSAEATA